MSEQVILTKEEKKAIRKAKAKKILKYIGGGLAIAAVTAGPAFLYGHIRGQMKALSSDAVKDIEANAAKNLLKTQFHTTRTGGLCTQFTNEDGNKMYMTYNVSDTPPTWWNGADGTNVETFSLVDDLIEVMHG